MKPPLERIKFSMVARNNLITLKKRTKIETFNVIARWGFIYSLAADHAPSPAPIPADSNLEMTWHTFAGPLSDALIVALKVWCHNHDLVVSNLVMAEQFRLHVHRGIGYLVGDTSIRSIEDLVQLAVDASSLRRPDTPNFSAKRLASRIVIFDPEIDEALFDQEPEITDFRL